LFTAFSPDFWADFDGVVAYSHSRDWGRTQLGGRLMADISGLGGALQFSRPAVVVGIGGRRESRGG
jgi:hypothetical protein